MGIYIPHLRIFHSYRYVTVTSERPRIWTYARHLFKFEEKENINIFYRLINYSIYSTRSLSEYHTFIENVQPEGDGQESGHLETEVNGELHGFFFRRYMAEMFCSHGVELFPTNESYFIFTEFYRIKRKKCFN